MRGRRGHKSQAPRWGSLLSLRLTGCSGPFCHSCAPRRDAHQVVIRGRSQCFAMLDSCQTQKRPPTALSSGGPGGTAQGVELQFPFRPVSTDFLPTCRKRMSRGTRLFPDGHSDVTVGPHMVRRPLRASGARSSSQNAGGTSPPITQMAIPRIEGWLSRSICSLAAMAGRSWKKTACGSGQCCQCRRRSPPRRDHDGRSGCISRSRFARPYRTRRWCDAQASCSRRMGRPSMDAWPPAPATRHG